jgi:hypothetical protein
MHMKGLCLAMALILGEFIPADAEEVWTFHPYVALGTLCKGNLADRRLSLMPIPLGAAKPDCAAKIESVSAASTRLVHLEFNATTGQITGPRPYR